MCLMSTGSLSPLEAYLVAADAHPNAGVRARGWNVGPDPSIAWLAVAEFAWAGSRDASQQQFRRSLSSTTRIRHVTKCSRNSSKDSNTDCSIPSGGVMQLQVLNRRA